MNPALAKRSPINGASIKPLPVNPGVNTWAKERLSQALRILLSRSAMLPDAGD